MNHGGSTSDWEASAFCLRPLHPSAAAFFLSGHHHRRRNLIALFLPQRIHSHQQLVLQFSPSSMGISGGVHGFEAIVRKEVPMASLRQLRDQLRALTSMARERPSSDPLLSSKQSSTEEFRVCS